MRIAVTGKQGQVVSALIEVGPKLGVEILAVGRPELDLLSPETVRPALANIRPNIIVNAAAYTAVDQAEKEPEVAMAVNAGGAMAVADAARTLGVPLVHLSTDYVFDGRKSTWIVRSASNCVEFSIWPALVRPTGPDLLQLFLSHCIFWGDESRRLRPLPLHSIRHRRAVRPIRGLTAAN